MKILFLCEPESPNSISWAEGLRNQGCEVVMASVRTDGVGEALAISNPSLPPRIRVLTGVSHLKKIISDIKPDILLAYRVTSYGFLAAKTGFHPLVLAAQNEQIVYLSTPSRIRSAFLSRCARFAISRADLMHAWSENIADGLVKFGADREKILTLHRGIDMKIFSAERGRKFDNTAPVFISTRSLYPEYRIESVVEAFSLVLKKLPGAILKIVGSGSEEEALKKQVQQLKLSDNILFLGRVTHNELVKQLNESDIYISIIETEGMSSSLVEAVACGVLPIVTDMPASRQIIDDKRNGFLINAFGIDKLAELMLHAVSEYGTMQPALKENSDIVKKQFNREINQKTFVEKYRKLCNV